MLTNEDRIRSFIGNIRNYDWDIFQVYRLEREDALAIYELLTQDTKSDTKKNNNNVF